MVLLHLLFQFKSSANSVMRGCVHAGKDVERLSCGFEVNINTRYSRLGDSKESLGRDFCVCGGGGWSGDLMGERLYGCNV